jgi:uncharacterized protein (DUF2336 family)
MASAADETQRLLRIARRKSDDGRRQLIAICGDLLSGDGTVLSGVEYALMRDVLARLVEGLAVPLRRSLSEHLAVIAPESTEIVAVLSAESIDLTAPLLLGIETALDLELVEIIRNRAYEHRLTLAMRRTQADSADVVAGEDAIDGLLRSPDAALAELVMAYLVEQSRRFDPFLEPVVRPEELSPALRRKLTLWLLAGLRHHLQQHHRIDVTRLDDAVEAVAAAAAAAATASPAGDAAIALARRLGEHGAIAPQLMLQVLRQGEVALFAALLAEFGRLRPDLARRLVFEPGGDGLAILCRAVDLGRSVLASIFLLTRRARPSQHTSGPGELSQVLALYDGIEPPVARQVLARWRRDRDFLTALRFIEEAATGAMEEDWRKILVAPTAPPGPSDADLTTNAWG